MHGPHFASHPLAHPSLHFLLVDASRIINRISTSGGVGAFNTPTSGAGSVVSTVTSGTAGAASSKHDLVFDYSASNVEDWLRHDTHSLLL